MKKKTKKTPKKKTKRKDKRDTIWNELFYLFKRLHEKKGIHNSDDYIAYIIHSITGAMLIDLVGIDKLKGVWMEILSDDISKIRSEKDMEYLR